jgi:Ca2+-binding EF-hand superfamily protein
LHHSCFLDPSTIKPLFKKTPLEGCEVLVTANFMSKAIQKVNIMEVFAALIAYSSCRWDEKVRLTLEIFDFDENEVITYDEMVVICKSFINGIGIMTQQSLYSKAALDGLADQAFVMADATPDGQVTYEE